MQDSALIPPDLLRGHHRARPQTTDEQADLATKRKAVQARLTQDIDAILAPLGYTRTGDTWQRTSALATSALQFQKGQHGFGAFINASAGPRWAARTLPLHRLAHFCPELGNQAPDEMSYLRLHDDPAFRDGVLRVIRARIVPWMEARHGIAGVLRREAPADMRRVPLFAVA
ncbi:MAG: DUF4304 domain-containing protein [Rhodobacteraceae bacterium]|jgi:hypothetical protein|nr:DUF4304 domain-containing protein [Paracoccaceae bacterium]